MDALPGPRRARPQPLRHHRRDGAAQRPAALRRLRVRRLRGGAQRQPDQRARAAGASLVRARLPVPEHHGLRGVHPPHRHQPLLHRGGPADRRAEAGAGRLQPGGAAQRRADRRARPARACGRWCSAGSAASRRRGRRAGLGAGQRDLRPRHRRRRVRARRRAGRDRHHRRHGRAQRQALRPRTRAASASSSTSTSPAPTAWWRARRSTRRASASAPSSRARAACRPTWWCRCPTAACRRPWATPPEAGIPFELGIIRNHYVGRTFIEPTDQIRHLGVKLKHSANRAGARRAGAWCWWTIPSCAAPPAARSWRWCARRARARCTCASPRRPRRIPATTASTRRSAAS